MKSAFALLTVAVVAVGLSGCGGLGGFLSPHGRCLVDGSCGHCTDCPETCASCEPNNCNAAACDGSTACETGCCEGCGDPACNGGCGLRDRLCGREYVNPGPPTGAVSYPYYTVRGPRDFLMKSPSPLGP
ncbi:MAG TPA: hypothetical protein VJL29_07800 [Thermoguttaceae bacterium]|nr:hypothetical protein [Thermoguttaceae bacterium]